MALNGVSNQEQTPVSECSFGNCCLIRTTIEIITEIYTIIIQFQKQINDFLQSIIAVKTNDQPSSDSPAINSISANLLDEFHSKHPQLDPDVSRDLTDHLLLKHVPSALSSERRAELEADLVPDNYKMSRAEIESLKEAIVEEEAIAREQMTYLKTLKPEFSIDCDDEPLDSCSDSVEDDMEEPVQEEPSKVPHLEQNFEVLDRERYCHYNPQLDPDVIADVVDHLLLKHVPSALNHARRAELAAELLPDTSKMSQSDINRLKKEIEERKTVSKRQKAFLETVSDKSVKSTSH